MCGIDKSEKNNPEILAQGREVPKRKIEDVFIIEYPDRSNIVNRKLLKTARDVCHTFPNARPNILTQKPLYKGER